LGLLHDHSCDHGHAPAEASAPAAPGAPRGPRASVLPGRRGLVRALVITGVFMLAEFVGGILTNSLALIADAGHMLTDAAAMALSLFAIWFACRPATAEKSYGYLRIEILAALFNGIGLALLSAFIFWEAWERFRSPPAVKVPLMLAIACAGLVVNAVCALVLHRSHHGNLNVRGAYAHVLGDLLGSVGAVAAGAVMLATGWYRADPLASAAVGVLILISAIRLVLQAVDVLLEAVPKHIDLEIVERELTAVAGVRSVHDVHVWTISSGVHLMTCHAVLDDGEHARDPHAVLERLQDLVRSKFDIEHSTIQIEARDLRDREREGAFCERL